MLSSSLGRALVQAFAQARVGFTAARTTPQLRGRDSEEQDLQVFASLRAVLRSQQEERLLRVSELSNGTTSLLDAFSSRQALLSF